MRVGSVALGLAAAGLVVTGCGGGGSGSNASGNPGPVQHPASLVADVGHNDEFVISLKDPSGAAIRNLAAGTYTVNVDDESGIHNFHLTGSGVDKSTTVPAVVKQTWTVRFSPGTYSFVCDIHVSQMHGKFTVT